MQPIMDNTVDHTTAPQPAEKPPTPEADLTGRTLGDYQVLRRLGQGGMGQVYLAEQVSLRRKVALKLLKSELASNPTSLARFKKEAEAVAQATHANIVQIYAIGEADGIPFMALEYVDGRNLRDFLEKKGTLDLRIALNIMRQVAEALKRASALGIVHRDIKPENILLTDRDEVKVADFGLMRFREATVATLRLTQSGDTLGTPLYMSPEQVEGREIDHRTDIYSFGVTCWHMMAGEPPFTGTTPYEVAFKHVQEEPRPLASLRPDLPAELCLIIHQMMAKDPADRFQTASELLDEICRLQQGETPLARPYRRRSHRQGWLFAASLLLAVLAGAGFAWYRQKAAAQVPVNPGPAATNPADVEVEGILPSQKREQALRAAVEEYLNPQGKTVADTDTGFRLCRDLGICYLDLGRLDEAEKHFERLEKITATPSYQLLGKLGLAIVLALKDKPEESNERFKLLDKQQLFSRLVSFWSDERKGPARKIDAPPALQPWAPPALRYWVVQALRYNQKNGLPDKLVPEMLLKLRDRKPMAP